MEYISSDTNVWIDFITIQKTELPFRLPYAYLMSRDAVEDELLSPPGISEELLSYGLIPVDITEDEFSLAEGFGVLYLRLSVYDRVALAIAKCRKIVLLTGDRALRQAAKRENVPILGTIALLDKLLQGHFITSEEYCDCLHDWERLNGGTIRLPKDELLARLRRFPNQ